MVVGGNVADMRGCEIFQPFVMRLKEFGGHGVACNAFILRPESPSSAKTESVQDVAGHVRCFQRVPEDAVVRVVTLR